VQTKLFHMYRGRTVDGTSDTDPIDDDSETFTSALTICGERFLPM
jgi:hypothetical protein